MGTLVDSSLDNNHHQHIHHPNFIISQLPYTSTADLFDFWTMILQQQVELIVCLCRDSEFNQQYYWPTSKQTPLSLFTLKVTLQSVKETANSIQRVFTVASLADNLSRTVVILQQNTASPQLSATVTTRAASVTTTGIGLNEMPENMSSFLKFVKECENFFLTQQRSHAHPILCHCVNGVSRSAVFLLVYSMIQIIDTSCDSSATSPPAPASISAEFMLRLVKQMRSKRKYMVQSVYHLKYAYDALLYYLKGKAIDS